MTLFVASHVDNLSHKREVVKVMNLNYNEWVSDSWDEMSIDRNDYLNTLGHTRSFKNIYWNANRKITS